MPDSPPAGPDEAPGLMLEDARPVSLADIRRPVEAELHTFQRYFREAMRSDVTLLDRVTQYVLKQKGKRIRPLLVLLAAKLCGSVSEATYRAAALVELLHTATLVHDDVVDDAERRRGVFSINTVWKNKVAVLFGDFLLSRGLLLSLDHGDYAVLHALSDAVRRMSEGELVQVEKSRLLDIDEDTYFRIISDKTASLIAACLLSGALSATDDRTAADRLKEAGEALGLAFQIRDDLFDFGASVTAGKPIGLDLKEKKMTLPLIYALRETKWWERRRILKIVKQDEKSRRDVDTVRSFVEEHGGLAYARRRMHEHARKAHDLLVDFPPTEARDALLGLVLFTVQRDR